MPNPFDQFDEAPKQAAANPFDQFDDVEAAPASQAPVNANPAQQFFTPSQNERASAWAEQESAGGLFPIEGNINEAYKASKQPDQELSYMDALRQSATPESMLDTAGAMVSGANNMLYAGLDDELANLAGMDGYEQTQDRLRAEKPQAFMGGQAIGGFVPFGQGMRLANPTTIKGAAATGGGLGALQGGAQAYGDADAEGQNRAQSGLQGGALGGAFGAGLSGGLAAAPAIKQGALSTLERMTPDGAVAQKLRKGGQLDNPTQQAMVEVLDATPDAQSVKSLRLTENLLRNSGLSPDRIAGGFNRIKQLKASGAHPRLSLARLIEREFANEAPEVSQNLRAFLMKVGMDSGKGRAIVTSATDSLRKTQADDLRGQASYELGSQSRLDASNQAKANMQGVGALYDEALRQAPRQGEMVDAAKELLGNYPKEVRAAVGKKALAARMSLDQYIEQNPLEAAHWTQSLIKQSEKPIDQAIAGQMTDILENSVPGYAGLRKQYADQATRREMVGYVDGGRESKGFGSDLVNKSGKELTADDMVERYRGLPKEHAAAADLSVRDAITDPLRLGKASGADEFGRDMAGARLSTLQREGVLDTMERMLGERGSRLSGQVKSFIDERQFAADIDPRTGSNTMNKATAQATGAAPVSGFMGRSFGGADGSVPSSLLLDGVLATTGNLPVATMAHGLPAGLGKMFQPREKTRNALADLLLRGSGGSDPTRSMFTGGGGVPPVNALNDGLLANNMPPPVAGDPMRPASGPIPGGPRDEGVNALADMQPSPLRDAPRPERPQTLTGFIRAQGGINDEGGEISAVLGGTNTVPGVISNVRRSGPESVSGKQVDYMIEAAIEEGFLPPGATQNDLFDALSRDVSAMGDDASRVYPEYGYRSDGVFDYLTWLQSKNGPSQNGFGGQNALANTAIGAGMGGLAPADSNEERLRNMVIGGGLGAGASRLDRMMKSRLPQNVRTNGVGGGDLPMDEAATYAQYYAVDDEVEALLPQIKHYDAENSYLVDIKKWEDQTADVELDKLLRGRKLEDLPDEVSDELQDEAWSRVENLREKFEATYARQESSVRNQYKKLMKQQALYSNLIEEIEAAKLASLSDD